GFDAAGNLYIAGMNLGSMDFGSGALQTKGDYDIVVAKLDTAYVLKWAFEFGDAAYQRFDGFGVDDAGNAVLGGTFAGKLDFGGGAIVAPSAPPNRTDAFIAKLNTSGGHSFSKAFAIPNPGSLGSAGDFQAAALSVDAYGDIAMTGVAPNTGTI